MTFAHRCVKGFRESQREAVGRIIAAHCFCVFSLLGLPDELEIGIAYEPGCAERWAALERDLQSKVDKSIRIV